MLHTGRTRQRAALVLSLLTAAALSVALPGTAAAGGSTFRVNTTGDGGDHDLSDGICDARPDPAVRRCTLRAAIQNANLEPDDSIIRFRIQTGNNPVKTIRPESPLPTITEAATIDGYTQPGASTNTTSPGTDAVLRIELDGRFITAAGLTATAPVTIRGLAIFWFGRGIQLSSGADGSQILGNFIGTDASGKEDRGNDSTGILVNAEDVRIGSIVRADRNLISGNTTSGINLGIAARRVTVQGNLIGVRKSGRGVLPNEGDGIFITGSDRHLIGGEFGGQGNIIGNNGGDGVALISVTLSGDTLVPTNTRISSNSIFGNAGEGIDLGDDGRTRNDRIPDADRGPNTLQNFPRLESAAQVSDGTLIRGFLASRRNADFEIQLFADAGVDPEGRRPLATFTVNTGDSGKVSFTRKVATVAVGGAIRATATDVERQNTSEFGPARTVTP